MSQEELTLEELIETLKSQEWTHPQKITMKCSHCGETQKFILKARKPK